jgi:hypothetical protein
MKGLSQPRDGAINKILQKIGELNQEIDDEN